MISTHQAPPAQPGELPAGFTLHSWYCPAMGAYRAPDEVLPPYWQHLLTQFEWVPLYIVDPHTTAPGWTLRSYYDADDKAFYASHRTISEKTAKQARLVELYAPPGAYGNDRAAHVPPKKK